MDLYNASYTQGSLVEALSALGVNLDGKVIMPTILGEYTVYDNGSAEVHIFESPLGGTMVTDENTNIIGNTILQTGGSTDVYNDSFEYVASIQENALGGYDVTNSTGNLELFSMDNGIGGKNFFSSDMQLLGISQEQLNQLNTSGFTDGLGENLNFEFPEVTPFSSIDENVSDLYIDFSYFESGLEDFGNLLDLFDFL